MPAYLSLKDHVYNYISNQIKEGRLLPNEKIHEKQIMAALQISSTPVREAFIELAVVGVLENIPRKGFFVKAVTKERVIELYQVIGSLDALCASLSIKHLTKDNYLEMQTIVTAMDNAIEEKNFNKYYELQNDFHHIYCNKCGNTELINTLNNLKKLFIRQSYENIDDENLIRILLETNDEHKEILTIMKSSNTSKLEKYIRDVHWSSSNSVFDLFE